MTWGLLTLLTLVSVVFFPWPLTAVLAVVSASLEPLIPFAAGLLVDTLYYAPQAQAFPLFTLFGLLVTLAAFFVRSRVRASIMRG